MARDVEYIISLTDKFSAKLDKIDKRAQETGKRIGELGKKMTLGVTLPVVGLGVLATKLASDFEETQSKFDVVFSELQGKANETADNFQKNFGLSGLAARQLLSSTGDLLTGFGFSQGAAFDLSTQVNELAADLASFSNFEGGTKGASEALTKALLGETEAAKALGIVIRQGTTEYKDRVKAVMAAQGVDTLQAKALVNLRIMSEQSKNALGDFARTQDSLANQSRIMMARLEDLGVEMGTILLPVAQKLVSVAQRWIDKFRGLSDGTKRTILIVAGLAAALGPLLIVIGAIIRALGLMAGVIGKVRKAVMALSVAMRANPIGLLITAVALLAIGIVALVKSTSKLTVTQKKLNSITAKYNNQLTKESAGAILLFNRLKNTNKGTAERSKLITQINRKYGGYLKNHLNEKISLDKIAAAQNEVIAGIKRRIAAKAIEEKTVFIIEKQLRREQQAVEQLSAFRREGFEKLLGQSNIAELIRGVNALQGTAGELRQQIFERTIGTVSDVTLEQINALEKAAAGASFTGFGEEKNLDILKRLVKLRKEDASLIDSITNKANRLVGGLGVQAGKGISDGIQGGLANAGITKITSAAPKIFNINIDTLVENINNNMLPGVKEGMQTSKAIITEGLLEVLGDVQAKAR